MIPLIEESILHSNPKFAALHLSLTKNILNPTSSTKHHPAQKEREVVSEDLRAARSRAAKAHLLLTALRNLDLSPPSSSKQGSKSSSEKQTHNNALPAELVELILLLSARLDTPSLPAPSKEILEASEQWTALPTHLPAIGALISTYLQTQALGLSRIQSPSTNSSFLHRMIPKVVPSVQTLRSKIDSKSAELQKRRTELASHTSTLLTLYHLAIALTIRILEQSKHGSASRHLKMKTDFLHVTAQTTELETREKAVRAYRLVYKPNVSEALGNYRAHLVDGRERLVERRREAERVLWGYGVGREGERAGEKERVMREVARVYGELRREVGEVTRDVERLRGG